MVEYTARTAHVLTEAFRSTESANAVMNQQSVLTLLRKGRELLAAEPSLLVTHTPPGGAFRVVGDTHGQFYDLCHIFDTCGEPSPTNAYCFNGDFVDRGSWGVEVFLSLLAWKLAWPESVHLTRGNHESRKMTLRYGFAAEAVCKYSETVYEEFLKTFQALPLGLVLDERALVLHGGLFSRPGVRLKEISDIDRFQEPPSGIEGDLMMELLWSDPMEQQGVAPNRRGGATITWGPDVSTDFLKSNGLELLVRSHQVCKNGWESHHNGSVYTIFSAPNYVDQSGNLGAVLKFVPGWTAPEKFTFKASPHPDLIPMYYLRLLKERSWKLPAKL